jgi:hypothetical protein
MLLTRALVIHYAMTCGHVDQGVAERMAAVAFGESGFETTAVNHNKNGTNDVGLYQINTTNFAEHGLTWQTAMDPCSASQAAATWFKVLSTYNTGNERQGFFNGYVQTIVAKEHVLRNGVTPRLLDMHTAARPPPTTSLTLDDQYSNPQ